MITIIIIIMLVLLHLLHLHYKTNYYYYTTTTTTTTTTTHLSPSGSLWQVRPPCIRNLTHGTSTFSDNTTNSSTRLRAVEAEEEEEEEGEERETSFFSLVLTPPCLFCTCWRMWREREEEYLVRYRVGGKGTYCVVPSNGDTAASTPSSNDVRRGARRDVTSCVVTSSESKNIQMDEYCMGLFHLA